MKDVDSCFSDVMTEPLGPLHTITTLLDPQYRSMMIAVSWCLLYATTKCLTELTVSVDNAAVTSALVDALQSDVAWHYSQPIYVICQ